MLVNYDNPTSTSPIPTPTYQYVAQLDPFTFKTILMISYELDF